MAVALAYPMTEPVAEKRGLPSSISEGEILGGKYRLEREIGRGTMGTVWSAVHLTLGQRVAIKLIAAEHAEAEEARQRFSTEAKAAARLRSRYVVQVYDDGETAAGTPYIVLEYLEGESLEQRLERERDLPLNDVVRMTRHVARALSRAHAAGIVHRDLKPANVFLTSSDDEELGWVAKVLDFGIAKVEEQGVPSNTKTGALLGTPLFMSPEQIRGANSVDSRSDLYSLGMVFYNSLTGNYAFNGDSFADVLVAICTGPLPDLRAAAPWVPASIADWFQRACARDPLDRFQSADEMIEGLDLALGVSTGAYPRQSSPEVLDTLRGHAPPVQHSVPRGPLSEHDEFTMGATHALSTDQALFATHHGLAAHTLDPDELASAPSLRRRWLLGGVVALVVLLAGTTLLFRRHDGVQPTTEVVPLPSARSAPVTLPTQLTPAAPTASVAPSAVAVERPEVDTPKAVTAGAKPSPARIPAPKSPTPRPIQATSKAFVPTPVSSPNTNTDIGF